MKNYLITAFLILAPIIHAQDEFVQVLDGRLVYPDGEEVRLWGVNMQSMLEWEYKQRMSRAGVPKEADTLKYFIDKTLDELEIMGCTYNRVHLTPADFTDGEGNLVETIYLDMLDYTTAEAAKRGMHSCYAFLNRMTSGLTQSFMYKCYQDANFDKHLYRPFLMFKNQWKHPSINYIKNLLNRTNPYTGIKYKDDPSIIVWGIMNEPSFLSYSSLKNEFPEEYQRFQAWLTENNLTENNGIYYPSFRKMRTKAYLNEIYDTIRATGSVQPVEWSLNWHKYRKGLTDVFEAVAESKVEVVSFCTYPGQGTASRLGGGSYLDYKGDLSDYDFNFWFEDGYTDIDYYGWTMTDQFRSKAKIVYEYEAFYNWSSYIYPVIADFQRALGAQAAGMWHYSMAGYAEYNSGSHILSLTCTPNKAASFAVAAKIYENTETYQDFDPNSPVEKTTDNYMYSYEKDLAIYSDEESYCYSASVPPGQLPAPHPDVKHIMGIGNSELVEYTGNGTYHISIVDDTLELNIQPNVSYNYELYSRERALITNLDYDTENLISLKFWNRTGNYDIYSVEDETYTFLRTESQLSELILKPGHYKIYLGDTLKVLGKVTREYWGNIEGNSISDLTNSPNYPYKPDSITFLTSLEVTDIPVDNFGQKLVGHLVAPESGAYHFWIASDHTGELWLGTDHTPDSRQKIAYNDSETNLKEWNKFASQESEAIDLVKDQSYILQALMKAGEGGGHLAVGWRKPSDGAGAGPAEIIPGSVVIPFLDTRGPTPPKNLSATNITETSCELSWDPSTDDSQLEAYLVFQDHEMIDSISGTFLSIAGLTAGTSYRFYVKAVDVYGNVSFRSNVLIITPEDHLPPTAPGNLTVSCYPADSCILSWYASKDNIGIDAYDIYVDGIWIQSVGDTVAIIRGLEMLNTLIITVKARDIAGNSSPASNEVSVTLPDTEAPTPPGNIFVSNITTNSCNLSWQAATDNVGIDEYEIYKDGVLEKSTWTTYTQIINLSAGTTYDFSIKARDEAGNLSVSSDTITVTTESITGIERSTALQELTLQPNPVYSQVRLLNAYDGTCSVFSVDGRIVLSQEYHTGESIILSGLDSGIYIFRLSNRQWVSTLRFTKLN